MNKEDQNYVWGIQDGKWTKWHVPEADFQAFIGNINREAKKRQDSHPESSYYDFPEGVEVRHISAHLTSFAGQIVQYASRSGRLDGKNKSEDLSDVIRDFEKIQDLAKWEIERLESL